MVEILPDDLQNMDSFTAPKEPFLIGERAKKMIGAPGWR
jgi:hypothetical protein